MSKDPPDYEKLWPELTVAWGGKKIAGWQAKLDMQPPPSELESHKLKRDISYMARIIERIKKGAL